MAYTASTSGGANRESAMEVAKAIAEREFASRGFAVKRVPVAETPRADLQVFAGDHSYFVEAKDKVECDVQVDERRRCNDAGEIFSTANFIAYRNRISGILRDAQTQLASTPNPDGAFLLIWLHSLGFDASSSFDQAIATFYGAVDLLPPGGDTRKKALRGLHFDRSEARSMPDIEALIVSQADGSFRLCLNDCASRADEFRASRLCGIYADLKAVYDPAALETNGLVVICRFNLFTSDESERIRVLQEQTGVLYRPIRATRFEATTPWTLPSGEPKGGD
jgi:hypothetical protein